MFDDGAGKAADSSIPNGASQTNGSQDSNSSDGIRIAIVGGGIVGLVTALGLLKRGIDVKVYEQARSLREIGAGVAFTTNAQKCMELVDSRVLQAMQAVSTKNPSAYYTYVDGFNALSDDPDDMREEDFFKLFAGKNGFDGCHRAHFLDQLVKLVPSDVVVFQKRLATLEGGDKDTGPVTLQFEDGTAATADAVIGCDGIRSRVRQLLVGAEHPAAQPSYTRKVAFRGLIPMEKAIAALGRDKALNQCMHMGPGAHVLNFPVAQHTLMNVVAFATVNEWPHEKMTAPAPREQVMHTYRDWAPAVRTIVSLLSDPLDQWAIFDLADHPLSSYSKGRICVAGDAAHACSPHHGAGAGFGIEDALALATVMEEVVTASTDHHQRSKAVKAAFTAYDRVRRERSQWLVQSARHICDTYEWADPGCGRDPEKCLKEIEWRANVIWNLDIEDMRQKAREGFKEGLEQQMQQERQRSNGC